MFSLGGRREGAGAGEVPAVPMREVSVAERGGGDGDGDGEGEGDAPRGAEAHGYEEVRASRIGLGR